ncbi:MAG: PVC-type heme-binding CxxCH protein [Acidobacteriota bacterium]
MTITEPRASASGQSRRLIARFLTVAALCLFACRGRQLDTGALSPEESIRAFRLSDDSFQVEVFAAEPHVVDPVEVVFDEDGRAYAAEMRDYPEDPPPGQPPRSRIRLMEDTDGDGRIDQSTIFAEGLLQVTSLMPWKGGLIVTSAPDILYLKDTDGDKRADLREVLFTGFALVNSESRITNLRFGVDNWIYASNNGQYGNIAFKRRPDAAPLAVLGADFRFRLDRGLFEAESGPAQFGLTIDGWGHRFITENTTHTRHVVVPRRYLLRNPFFTSGPAAVDISDHGRPAKMFQLTPPQDWRRIRTEMRQQRYKENKLDRKEIAAGTFTGASGATLYIGDTFPEQYRGSLFTGDVAGNLVHRDVLRPDGATFVGSRSPGEQDREFLASTDPWFRPCNFATGPDGNLYVVDIYREFIETPESVPEELKKNMNFYNGDTLGRIYRIVPKNGAARRAQPRLSRAAASELVALLEHPNGWWSSTAQRLLLERQDRSVVEPLRRMAVASKVPEARLRALYALDGLSALDADLVSGALKDGQPGVRENALQMAEAYPQLQSASAALIDDSSLRVQFQLALSLGGTGNMKALRTLATLADRHADNSWFGTAILSSPHAASTRMIQLLLDQTQFFQRAAPERIRFVEQLAAILGARANAAEIDRWLEVLAGAPAFKGVQWQTAGLAGLGRGLALTGVRLKIPSVERRLASWLADSAPSVHTAALRVAEHFEMRSLVEISRRQALDASLAPARRAAAVQLLTSAPFESVRAVFESLLTTATDAQLLETTISALGRFDHPDSGPLVISRWKTLGPEARARALAVLLNHRTRVPLLASALETGRIEPAALDLAAREQLLQSPDPAVAATARKLFAKPAVDRRRLLDDYSNTPQHSTDPARGRAAFEKNCASCHLALKGKRRVGPDLSGVSSQTRLQLLEAILDPSRSIAPRYLNYIITTRDGRILDGLILAETPGTITLRSGSGQDETVLRANIERIRTTGVSLMPDGFEKILTKQDVADVIGYLQGR